MRLYCKLTAAFLLVSLAPLLGLYVFRGTDSHESTMWAAVLWLSVASIISALLWRSIVGPIQAILRAAARDRGGQEALPMRIRSGDEIGALAEAFHDMSQRLGLSNETLANEILARERADRRFRQLFEAAPSGLVMIDREGRMVLMNAQIEALFGYAPGELSGEWIEVLVPYRFRQRHAQHVGSFLADPQTRALGAGRELFGLRKDGSEFPVEIGIRPMETDEGLFVLAAIVDISERKRAERELAGYALELQRSISELQQFAYVASHDLKEPLRMVSSYTTLLDEEYGAQLDDNARKYIHYAVDGATRMAAMIDDLLDFSRVGRSDGPVCEVELNGVLERVLADLAATIDEAGAKIDVQRLPAVSGNSLRLGQLFQNLIGNAVKFRGAPAPVVQVSCERREKFWEFRVADNGIGIPEEFLDRVFQLFQRLHTRDEYPGNGIGLAVCKKIVEHYGGQIWARSQPGQGTTLFFTLPIMQSVPYAHFAAGKIEHEKCTKCSSA